MKKFAKVALGAVMLAGAAVAVSSPAQARVVVGIGGPAYYGPGYSCNPYSRWYDPYRCGYYAPRYYRGYYGGPSIVFGFGGGWRGGHGWHRGHGGWHGGRHHR